MDLIFHNTKLLLFKFRFTNAAFYKELTRDESLKSDKVYCLFKGFILKIAPLFFAVIYYV